MFYFGLSLHYFSMLLIMTVSSYVSASLPPATIMGAPSNMPSSVASNDSIPGTLNTTNSIMPSAPIGMPLVGASNNSMPGSLNATTPLMPPTSLSNVSSLMPTNTSTSSSTPTTSAPLIPTTPNILTALPTSTPALTLAPVAVTTTQPVATSQGPTGTSLGSGITNIKTPKGMITTGPSVALTNTPLTKTLDQLLTGGRSCLSAYDMETRSLLRSGGVQQKSSALLRPHTDANISDEQFKQNPCTQGAQQVTAKNKMKLSRTGHILAKSSTMSFTRHKNKSTLKEDLFNNSDLETEYKAFVNQIKSCPSFIPTFTKFHILALAQLYQYLTSIYVTLTITHFDSLDSYILFEQKYDLNKKALIVQYLVALVEAQLNQALLQLFPNLRKSFAVQSGLSSLSSDHITRLDLLFANMEQIALATFGLKIITSKQWKTIISLLDNPQYKAQRAMLNEVDLAILSADLEIFVNSPNADSPTTPSFLSLISPHQKSLLVDYLDILTTQFSHVQEFEDCQQINQMLQNKDYAAFTEGQYTLLKGLIAYYALTSPLKNAIKTVTSLQTKLASATPNSITGEEVNFLKGLCSLFLNSLETRCFQKTRAAVMLLEPLLVKNQTLLTNKEASLFDSYKTNSPYDRIKCKELATALTETPSLLANLTDLQKKTFMKGVEFYKKNNPLLTPSKLSLVEQLTATVTTGNVTADSLIDDQKTLYDNILTLMLSYTSENLTPSNIATILNVSFKKDFTDFISNPTSLKKFNSKYFEKLSPTEQLMIYCSLQLSFDTIQSRIEQHKKDMSLFACFSLYHTDLEKILFRDIAYTDYDNIRDLATVLDFNTEEKNIAFLNTLSEIQKKVIIQALNLLVAPPDSKTGTGLFEKLSFNLAANPKFNKLDLTIAKSYDVDLAELSTTVASQNFTLANLSPTQTTFITAILTDYEALLAQVPAPKVPSSQTPTQGLSRVVHPLSKDDDLTANTILSVMHAELHMKKNQAEMVKSLGIFFDFFATYTASLHVKQGDTISVIDKDVTQFGAYARSFSEQLASTQLGNAVPALFIYDQITLDYLTALSYLAQTVKSSSHLFLPTQAIDMALMAHPVPDKMIPGPSNNQTILKEDIPYNIPSLLIPNPDNPSATFSPKFFFKDKDGNAFANGPTVAFPAFSDATTYQSITHPKIGWLAKVQIPSNDPKKPPTYEYHVVQEPQGEEGIYINIPLLQKDSGDKSNVLARLYEQKIIPQLAWLNEPEKIIGMTRACLGDFVTGLMLDETIFDPVINYLIRYTLVNTKIPADAGIKGMTDHFTQDYLKKDLNKYRELSQKELLDTYAGPGSTTPIVRQGVKI